MILGPFYFSGLVQVTGIPGGLIQVNDVVLAFAQIGAIVILFIAGLEMPFREFVRGGVASFTTGALGVVLPFAGGLTLFLVLGFNTPASLMVAAALTATSIAISIETLRELGRLKSPEGKLIIGAAVVDDILAIAVLSVVVSLIREGPASFDPLSVALIIMGVLFLFAVLLGMSELFVPRLTQSRIWKTKGSLEAVVTATFFGMAALAGVLGLSPIIGSFAVGMALAGANIAQRMADYVEKLQFIFRPLFFAVIGAQVNVAGITPEIAAIGAALIAVAVVTKIAGCGLPAVFFLKSWKSGRIVGTGMISRGEIGLIVAGLALASGTVPSAIYSVIVLMVIATTIITPLLLRRIVAAPVSIESLPITEPPARET
jgi:Kef-type K+ transport system membrane component KefB